MYREGYYKLIVSARVLASIIPIAIALYFSQPVNYMPVYDIEKRSKHSDG